MKALSLLCLLLVGCRHSVMVINLGVANKSATAYGVALTPETYCVALSSSNISFDGKPAPALTQEQQDFCKSVIETDLKIKKVK